METCILKFISLCCTLNGPLPMYDIVISSIGYLETTDSVGYENLPRIFHYTILKKKSHFLLPILSCLLSTYLKVVKLIVPAIKFSKALIFA